MSESTSSVGSVADVKEQPKVEAADILLRNSQSSRAQFKNQVYSFAGTSKVTTFVYILDKEKDFHLDRSINMESKSGTFSSIFDILEPLISSSLLANTSSQKPPFGMSQSYSVLPKTNVQMTASLDISKVTASTPAPVPSGTYKSSVLIFLTISHRFSQLPDSKSYSNVQEEQLSPREERMVNSSTNSPKEALVTRSSVPAITSTYIHFPHAYIYSWICKFFRPNPNSFQFISSSSSTQGFVTCNS